MHGLGTGPSGWRPQAEALDDREVIVPRLPLDVVGAARLTVRLVDDQECVDLAGLSLGALTALQAAVERPNGVRRLVLAAGFARLPRQLRVLQLGLAATARFVPTRVLVRGLVASLPANYRAEAQDELAAVTSAEVARVMRAGARFDLATQAHGLDTPTLVVCGARDRHNLPLSRDLAALLPRAELCVIADAGHVVNLEKPDTFTAALRRFVDAP